MKIQLKQVGEYQRLYRDSKTGLAWVEDGSTGTAHSAHPNIHSTGSVTGMKRLGYWGKEDRIIHCRGFAHNIDRLVVSDDLDETARQYCQCGGKH